MLRAIILIALMVPFAAEAKCVKRNLAGVYSSYSSAFDIQARCIFKVGRSGAVKKGNCANTLGQTSTITGGRLKVDRFCEVTGFIAENIGDTDIIGDMSRDKTFITGVGFRGNDSGTFIAVKK